MFLPGSRLAVSEPVRLFVTGICLACLALAGCSLGQSQSSSTPSREERWRQDLRYLRSKLPASHKNAFFKTSKESFEAAVAALDKNLGKLKDYEVITEIARIVAMLGDGHTNLALPQAKARFKVFPLKMYWYDDGIFVTATTEAYKRALGARLIKIGETEIEKACEAAAPLIPHENDMLLKLDTPAYLSMAEVLWALKLLPEEATGKFTFKDGEGEFTLELAPVPDLTGQKLLEAPDRTKTPPPLYLQNPNTNYWFTYQAETKLLYCQYNVCQNAKPSFKEFAKNVLAEASKSTGAKCVLDLRMNGGGDSRVFSPLLDGIKKSPALNQKGKLFVVLGRRTFSSALLNALDLLSQTQAISVGEATGGKPNHYGEVKELTLPNSGLRIGYSTKYFNEIKEDADSLQPMLQVGLSSSDYFAGRDPVLEKILAY